MLRCRIFSIDPSTARDLDDALSIEPLPTGNYRVGVHIADVAHFVRWAAVQALQVSSHPDLLRKCCCSAGADSVRGPVAL